MILVQIEQKKDPENWSCLFSYADMLAQMEKHKSKIGNPLKIENDDISADSKLMVTIENNKYQNFEKYIILSTRNVFGGKNSFLGICYVVFGGICLLSAVIFINVYNYVHKKK